MKQRLTDLMTEYGKVALATYLVIFVAVFAGFTVSIMMGVEPDSAMGSATTVGAAWLATKLTQPLRIAATVVLTPAVATVVRRRRRPQS